ncbi:MAG: hypothetical protein JRJ79_11295 [Deltaproteobacteria bacterium]|nr:hypothetical protein [Deltaproteobacteria bacterium]MBW1793493.1 hypothetical protein [Deltaproteobacteria bacterium]
MMNFKQKELSAMLFSSLKNQYPEIELVNITESPEDPNDLWINIVMPEDEDREIECRELSSEISMDILLDYGYHITISPAPRKAKIAA